MGSHRYKYLALSDDESEEAETLRTVPNYKVVVTVCLVVVALCFPSAGLAYLSGKSVCTLVDVMTPCGKVRGQHCGMAHVFKGIPYAKPPIGDLRWRPPQDPTCWNETLHAAEFKSMCAQVRPLSDQGQVMGSEDCLYINVWTTSVDRTAKLPVMVWIHGGYLHVSSGSETGYSPTADLVEHSSVVHVSFNYRLNAFGFMALEVLREGSPTNKSGNYGFMDQLAALRWVQKNIENFGGDPDKVTIYGQSSGGTSVWALMVSPLAKGLFHRAIDMSGSAVFSASIEEAERDNLVFLKSTGCQDAKCLRQLNITKILQSIPWKGYPNWAADDLCDLPDKGKFIGPVAVVDGYVVPAPPLDVWKKKMDGYSDVPFVVGTTLQETEFGPLYSNISQWTEEDYRWFVKVHLDTFGGTLTKEALTLYPTSEHCADPTRCIEKAYMTMVSDLRATCPMNEVARQAKDVFSSPVYRYVVTYSPSKPAQITGLFTYNSWFAFHMLDAIGFFGSLDYALGTTTEADRDFQRLMRQYFLHFAKEGKMPDIWPEYPNATALLSRELTAHSDYRADQCAFWERNDMFQYAWIN
ncbi:hypothetical protein GDO86_019822 [Hymenochirus boettgeri]|uniref:Carboxylic ester hydrolase n=1 Tax=Hymenochirus boettgeri TaxID=247094 RepID=A0A8T2IIK2_9PIPI|nr:hypothetical protein GDO86_019822 [Hymenochirus boettgeri]